MYAAWPPRLKFKLNVLTVLHIRENWGEQMLSVVEEFLLLTLKDEGGVFLQLPVNRQQAAFIGAAIMELGLQGRIDSDLDQVMLTDPTPTGDKSLDVILFEISAQKFDRNADKLIDQLIGLSNHVRASALKNLCAKNILEEKEGRVLWLLKTRRYPAVGGKEIREVKLRLLEILLGENLPDPRDVCLMALADTCGIIDQIVPVSELPRARERIQKFSKMEIIGQNVDKYIRLFEEALALSHAYAMTS